MHLAFDGALGHHDTGCGGDQQRGDLRHQPVADRQGRVGRERTLDGHVRPEQAHRQTAENVNQRDDQGADGVAADELAGAVHRAVEAAFLGQFGAAFAGSGFIDGAGRKVRVDRHLLAWHRVEVEARGDFRDAAGSLGDDDEIHHQQHGENDRPDHQISAHQKRAEGRDDMAGSVRTLVAVRQDQPRGGDVQRQPQDGRQQQQRRQAGEIERPLQRYRDQQDQDRCDERQRQRHVQQERRNGEDQDGKLE